MGDDEEGALEGDHATASSGLPLEERMAAIEAAVAELPVTDAAAAAEIRASADRLLLLLESLRDDEAHEAEDPAATAYQDLVRRLVAMVEALVPVDATVAVITRGDDHLLDLPGRKGWHFPQDASGRWIGYHPRNSLAAIAQLEGLRAQGADHLVVPASSSWWFETYVDFGRRLTSRYVELPADPAIGRIFDLSQGQQARSAVQVFLEQAVSRSGSIEVLDLAGGSDLLGVPGVEAFRPLNPGSPLPYADRSIPVVAIDSRHPNAEADAARKATLAVVDVARDEVLLVEDQTAELPAVSVIMPVFDNARLTAAALESLAATLPPGFSGEVIVIDDGSAEETRRLLEDWQATTAIGRVLRNPENRGYLTSLVRGIEAAAGEYLLLVNNDVVFLDGWLEPLLRTFEDFPDAGAAGGRLLYPDGRLQEAGGLLFGDGSAAKYGYGDADNGRAGYSHVRLVDYCSGCLLLTSRAAFTAVGGVDRRFEPGYYEDTDYCLRLRLAGYGVYYQPESVVVHVEGGTAGMDPDVGMKRHQGLNQLRFVDKWGHILRDLQPERPEPCDDAALHALVIRHTPTSKASS